MRPSLFLLAALMLIPAVPASADTATETVGFSINVEPVFLVTSDSEEGGNIPLGPVGPGGGTSTKSATVSVRTNSGRPYRIIQRLEQKLLNDRGAGVAEEPVLFTVTDGVNGGRSEVRQPAPLTTERTVIFSSDSGEPDDFRILYTVSSGRMIPAGSYRARVVIEEEMR